MRPILLAALVLAVAAPASAEVGVELAASRAALAAKYMTTAESQHGRFGYEYDFVQGRFLDADNIVRQAGAAFVVAEYLDRTRNQDFAKFAERAIAYHAGRSVAFSDGLVVSREGTAETGSAGATALALLAELHAFEATGSDRHAAERKGWVRGLMALQLASGGFAVSPGSSEESSYYNGETWLALAHYNRLFPEDEAVAAALARAEPYLMDRYGKAPDGQFAHWGLMAASVRHAVTGETRFLDFLRLLSTAFLDRLKPSVLVDANSCSMIEGLAAAAPAISASPADRALAERMAARIDTELAKSLSMQILPGQTAIRLGAERVLTDPTIAWFAGAFLNGRFTPRARIDYTQHCLSALMKYEAYRGPKGG